MKTFLPLMLTLFGISGVFAADLVITPASTSAAQCPLVGIDYFVTVSSGGLPSCTYNWTVAGGSFVNGISTGTSVKVIWSDLPGTGTLTVTTNACNPTSENNSTKTNTYTRLSVFGKSFLAAPNATCTNTIDVPFCSTNAINVCADKMFVQNTGALGEPPLKEVDKYIFSIPAGWKEFGTNNIGPINLETTLNFVSLEPLGASGGTITVIGSIRNTCTALGVSNSNPKTITITRSPAVNITSPGYQGPQCGDMNPVTFSVTAIACATSYSWSKPAAWTGSSTTNTITLTPDGFSGGTLSVVIGLSTGGTITRSFTLTYTNPGLSTPVFSGTSPQLICSNGSGTASIAAIAGAGSYSWYTTGGTAYINGVLASSSNPVVTTSTSITLSAPLLRGIGYEVFLNVVAGRPNAACAGSGVAARQVWFGKPANVQTIALGLDNPPPFYVCQNNTYQFNAFDFTNIPSTTTYSWYTYGYHTIVSYNGTGHITANILTGNTIDGTYVSVRSENSCGFASNWTDANLYQLGFGCGGGGCGFQCTFSMSPNPSNGFVEVAYIGDEEPDYQIGLYSPNGTLVFEKQTKDKKTMIDTRTLKNGLYILKIITKEDSYERRLKIEK